ncbi:Uncharacterised protein [Suttonella indologenes]|uniref:Uncharacterized protein n=1 Tax=Suttonella indologenes TaxID=13276 RepID=A0A380N147_9GAMM|nr:Uncharacterised protein [Suttonella indologenes]
MNNSSTIAEEFKKSYSFASLFYTLYRLQFATLCQFFNSSTIFDFFVSLQNNI